MCKDRNTDDAYKKLFDQVKTKNDVDFVVFWNNRNIRRKQPGDVAQTILVPYDANDTVKNSVGNIFKTLNTNLK